MIHCKLILNQLSAVLIGDQAISGYKSDKYAFAGFGIFCKRIHLCQDLMSILFVNGKFCVMKFYFTEIDHMVGPVN